MASQHAKHIMSKYPEGKFDRHPLSVPGPFYVEDGQCINCLAPADEAPDLFGHFEEPPGLRGCSHCYVKQQPGTPEEMERMIQAIQASCCSGLRYCGEDPAVLKRLQQAGFAGRCDELWDECAGAAQPTMSPAPTPVPDHASGSPLRVLPLDTPTRAPNGC